MLQFYLSLLTSDADKSKFETLYENHRLAMLWTAQNILKDRSLAEDAVHDAFLRVIDHLENITPENCNSTRSFLVIIVRNISLDYLRRRKKLGEVNLDDFEEYLEDEQADPEQLLIGQETSRRMQDALEKINPAQADLLALHVTYEMTYKEIAQLVNQSAGNVKVQIHRARARIARLLKEDEEIVRDV
jgi:RNA polymerase sigma-70 factor, ECF subfamily